jgi:hypothetical protein
MVNAVISKEAEIAKSIVSDWHDLPDKPSRYSMRSVIGHMLDDIKALLERGYQLREVHELICQKGVEISWNLFRQYYYSLRKEGIESQDAEAIAPSQAPVQPVRKSEREVKSSKRNGKKTPLAIAPSVPSAELAIAPSVPSASVEQKTEKTIADEGRATVSANPLTSVGASNASPSENQDNLLIVEKSAERLTQEAEMRAKGFNVSVRPNYG